MYYRAIWRLGSTHEMLCNDNWLLLIYIYMYICIYIYHIYILYHFISYIISLYHIYHIIYFLFTYLYIIYNILFIYIQYQKGIPPTNHHIDNLWYIHSEKKDPVIVRKKTQLSSHFFLCLKPLQEIHTNFLPL